VSPKLPEGTIKELQQNFLLTMTKALSGGEIETKDYQITLSVPLVIAEMAEQLGKTLGIDINTFLSQWASQGLMEQVKSTWMSQMAVKSPATPQAQEQDLLKQSGIDITGLTDKLAQMKKLAADVQNLQKALENATTNLPPRSNEENKKDSS